jgi:hypothetical protein
MEADYGLNYEVGVRQYHSLIVENSRHELFEYTDSL